MGEIVPRQQAGDVTDVQPHNVVQCSVSLVSATPACRAAHNGGGAAGLLGGGGPARASLGLCVASLLCTRPRLVPTSGNAQVRGAGLGSGGGTAGTTAAPAGALSAQALDAFSQIPLLPFPAGWMCSLAAVTCLHPWAPCSRPARWSSACTPCGPRRRALPSCCAAPSL